MTYLLLAAGLGLLFLGGELLVRGAVGTATRLGISPMVIGLTLVGFGTSTPELVASLQAALAGAPGIAIGNVVGSNLANILLILGVSGLILPVVVNPSAFRRDGTALALATIAFIVACLGGELGRIAGVIFLVGLAGYTLFSYISDRRSNDAAARMHAAEADFVSDEPQVKAMSLPKGLLITAIGIAGVMLGADFLVGSAVEIAREFGMSEAVIGLTLVAIGTSLPELVTSVMAAIRRHGDVAFGNVIGSNIFNILGIAGVTALVKPIPIPPEVLALDLWAMAAATVLLLFFAWTGWRIGRRESGIFLAAYLVYLAAQLSPGIRGALGLA
ncbi:calcium/sodium antiporter [Tistrella mobilis]|uniref:Sodium:calcium antiporter n=1 Tax=Tistrella mobilis TaxID=171437 RepID=A0A162KS96_9PROT|nr:calcium/sodium antiporter [Tistrella mobilis]KYO51981.1 sodium:calcium antiporter [Tistrella mobilis]